MSQAASQKTELPAPRLFVSPTGSDTGVCTRSAPCSSWNRAYQGARPGDVIEVAGGVYAPQLITPRSATRNLTPGCTPAVTTNCIVFQPAPGARVFVDGPLSVQASSVWIRGTARPAGGIPQRNRSFNIAVRGYVDAEPASEALTPDHVIVEGVDAVSFGVFGTRTATFRNLDVGPATVGGGCRIVEGPGFENKIGMGNGVLVPPTDVTLDRIFVHNQNRNVDAATSDCHFGGLFVVTVDGLTIKNSVFSQNAVYNIQVQNFGGPPPRRVRIENNWFGCPVLWLYDTAAGGENACNGQVDLQFNAASLFADWLIRHNSFAGGIGQYVEGATYQSVRVLGNATAGFSACYPGMTFAYNASEGRTCSSSDRRVNGAFVSKQPGQEDLRLRPRSAARAFVQAASPDLELAVDMEGHVRPLRYPRDAGALQRDTALVVPGRSIGSAAIGMKHAEVLRRYGAPASSRRAKLGPAKAEVLVDTFRVTGGTLRVATAEERVVAVETASPYYTTLTGLGPGSTRAEVARLPAAWRECGKDVQQGGRLVTVLELGKRKVSSLGVVRRAYAPECSPKGNR